MAMENGNGITKADLKAALAEFKTELKAELKAEIVGELTMKMQTMNDDLTEKMRQIETNLLTEFHRYGKGQQLRLHTLESRDAIVTERLAIIEERLLHLESRRPPTV
jgi:hypothetical protein